MVRRYIDASDSSQRAGCHIREYKIPQKKVRTRKDAMPHYAEENSDAAGRRPQETARTGWHMMLRNQERIPFHGTPGQRCFWLSTTGR